MKFVVSSIELLSHLQAVSRVINSKNTLPILDNILFDLSSSNELTLTASDLETTLITKMQLENAAEPGVVALPAKLLTDTLKEFADQPLSFDINMENYAVVISSENGKFNIVGQNGSDFPAIPKPKAESLVSLKFPVEVMASGISKTQFATADDEMRPVMNGIFVEFTPTDITFVASDSHKLVRYKRTDVSSASASSFILPKKPANLLRNILPKDESSELILEFDNKNAYFTTSEYRLVCRLIEGAYPSYNAVIPTNNPNVLTIDRLDLYNSLRRVSVFSNQSSNLIKLSLSGNSIMVSAQDIDFSISAYERLNCIYDGDEMDIGFKSAFLVEILSNIGATSVKVEMSDPTRAGIVIPTDKDRESEDLLMLLMPMSVGI